MFSAETYKQRRAELARRIGNGLILISGNTLSPFNYPNNTYSFRQDSTFLYYFGLNIPSLMAVIDAESGEAMLFGDDFTVEDIIWTGPQPCLVELGAQVGVSNCQPLKALDGVLATAMKLNRRIHFLPPYRGESKIELSRLLGLPIAELYPHKSVDLMFAVAEMREVKSAEEIEALERAFQLGYAMHTTAMKMCKAGVVEREIAGAMEGIAKSQGLGVSFPSIVSQHGETLHNLNSDGVLENGRLLLVDGGNRCRVGRGDALWRRLYRRGYHLDRPTTLPCRAWRTSWSIKLPAIASARRRDCCCYEAEPPYSLPPTISRRGQD